MLWLVGGLFLAAGILYRFFPPKKINSLYGYRTLRSMKNQKTWNFAQRSSSSLVILAGCIALVLGSLALFIPAIASFYQHLLGAALVFACASIPIIATEKALIKHSLNKEQQL